MGGQREHERGTCLVSQKLMKAEIGESVSDSWNGFVFQDIGVETRHSYSCVVSRGARTGTTGVIYASGLGNNLVRLTG